ncbi:MAG TPA: radical SAM protein [Elusimicrobiota bacterium]|nr:radical SAM protein [Elusimicrobiota bacterium]
MSKILLINPAYADVYGASKAGLVRHIIPTLGLATIAADAVRRGHRVKILDMSDSFYDWTKVQRVVREFGPDVVGISATTPLMNQLRDLSVLCRDISKDILLVGGGAHVSALPERSLEESFLDVVVAGEGDIVFGRICDGDSFTDRPGLCRRLERGTVVGAGEGGPLENLDDLPMPAWHLYDPAAYRAKTSRLIVRCPPCLELEFSRGCAYDCHFCASKKIHPLGHRKKSSKRCAEEVKTAERMGWREFVLADDIFTSNREWALSVCEELIRSETSVRWSCLNGIRVDSADLPLFRTMRRAGCYRLAFGFETGNEQRLRASGKGGRASLEAGRRAVRWAREAGMETCGYFLIGLDGDTKETVEDTIAYACSLGLDMLKFGVAMPFPGSALFDAYLARGAIRSFDWDAYNTYANLQPFEHSSLSREEIGFLMGKAYRETVGLNPAFWFRRLRRGLGTGDIFWDPYYFLKFLFSPALNTSRKEAYYARPRWPQPEHAAGRRDRGVH